MRTSINRTGALFSGMLFATLLIFIAIVGIGHRPPVAKAEKNNMLKADTLGASAKSRQPGLNRLTGNEGPFGFNPSPFSFSGNWLALWTSVPAAPATLMQSGTWVTQTSGTVNTLNAIHFINNNEGWAAGGNATLLRTSNGGTSWSACLTGVAAANGFNSVRFLDANLGFAGGHQAVRRVSDGCPTGSNTVFGDTNFRYKYFPVSSNVLWVSGFGSSNRKHYRYTFDGAGNITDTFTHSTPGFAQLDLYFADADNGWSVGTNAVIVRITNASTATPVFTVQTSVAVQQLSGVFMLDLNTGWIVGNSGMILKTSNGGTNWTQQPSGTTAHLNDVHFINANEGWIVGASGLILHSTDGGASWVTEASGTTAELRSLHFPSATTGYAVGASGTILKRGGCPALTLTPAAGALPAGTQGTAYNQTFTAGGGTPNYAFSVSAGSLPPGLTLAAGGALSGMPSAPGSYSFTIQATDQNGCAGMQAYSMMINPPPVCVPPPSGLVSWWTGDGNANDLIGGNHGMLQNGATYAFGVVGQAFQFNGIESRVEIPHSASLDFGTTDITIDAWVKAPPEARYRNILGKESQSYPHPSIIFNLDDQGRLQFGVTDCGTGSCGYSLPGGGGSRQAVQSPMRIDDDFFHHITGVRRPNGYELYVDGQLVASRIEPARNSDNTVPLYLGIQAISTGGSVNNPFNGLIEEVEIFNRALSASEIQAIFNAGPAGKCKNQPPVLSYGSPQSATVGQSLTVNPASGPSDDGTITSITVQSVSAGFTGSVAVNNVGVVTIGNAAPQGSFFVTIRATDNDGATTDASFTLTVGDNAPTITAGGMFDRQQGSPEGAAVLIATVNDTETPRANLVVTVMSAPAGISITGISAPNATTGEVTATVAADCTAAIGANTVVLKVTDGNSGTATANLTVNVTANSAPVLTYNNQSVAAGGSLTINPATGPSDNGSVSSIVLQSQGTYTGTISVNNTTGVVSISGAKPGSTHTITIRATDNCGMSADATFNLTVNCQTITVNPSNPSLPSGTVNAAYSQSFTQSGGSGTVNFAVIAGVLPPGLSLSSGGALTGTPTQTGTFNFTVKATDANNCMGERAYSLVINPACPAVSNIAPTSGVIGAQVTINGSGFSGVSGVTFANNVSAGFTVVSDTQITTSVPTGATTGPITLGKNGCSDVQTPVFTILSCPAVSNIAPNIGAAGSQVVITGANFTGVTGVKFANNINASFTVNSDSQITATVPNGATAGAITLSKAGCPDAQTATFTVCNQNASMLMVDDGSFEVAFGATGGGSSYYVNRLTPCSYPATLSQVKIFFQPYSNPPIGSTVTLLVGTNADGDANINSTSFQTSTATVQTLNAFNTYNVTPVTITAGDFVIGFRLTHSSSINPAALDETAPVQNRSYYSLNGTTFTLVNSSIPGDFGIRGVLDICPTVTNLNPTSGSAGAQVVITGPGFTGVTAVKFGGQVTAMFTVDSDTQITATVPAGATSGPITLSKPNCADVPTLPFTVMTPPTITPTPVSRTAGSPSAISQIATVNDAQDAPNLLIVTVNGGSSATLNGVTVSGISVNAAGVVTADVVASCTATNAIFTLRVTDSGGLFAEAPLNVTVTANPPPTVGNYSSMSLLSGGSTTVTPDVAPADNGSIQSIVATVSPNTFTGTLSGNTATGAVTITNANLPGSYIITVTVTDNCGATVERTFSLTVCPTITVNPPMLPNGTLGQAYAQTISQTGGVSPVNFIVSAGALPPGLMLNPATGELTGTPSQAGSFVFTIKATDANDCMGTRQYSVMVFSPPPSGGWSAQTSGTTNTLRSVHFLTDGEGWVAGDNVSLLHTTNGGTTWPSVTNTSVAASRGFNSVRLLNQQTVWTGGQQSVIRTLDGGNIWGGTQFTSTSPSRNRLFPVSSTVTWAVGGGSCFGFSGYIFFRYTFNANGTISTFTSCSSVSGALQDIYFVDADNGWAVGNGGAIIRVTNAGGASPNFNTQPSGTTQQLVGVFMLDLSTGWAVGNNGTILKTVNGGASWTAQAGNTNVNLNDVHFVNASQGWVVGNGGTILFTTDGGATWTPESSPTTQDLLSLFFTNPSVGYAVGANGTIIKRAVCPTITVLPENPALPPGNTGQPYSQTFTAGGGAVPYAFTVSAGSLPAGLNLDAATGVLSGTPTAASNSSFIVTATDVNGCAGSRAYTLYVAAALPLTVTRAGDGTGMVTSNPAGINCGANCAASFAQGTVVTLTAAPDACSTFTGWSGACTGTGSCVVTMNTAQFVTANFAALPFTIAPTNASFPAAGGSGSVQISGTAGCAWAAVSNDGWITITSGASGTGNGTVNYTVGVNGGAARSGTMTIAGRTFTVTQSFGGQTLLVTNTNDSGPGSLRQAILDANAIAGANSISFNIPTSDAGFDGTVFIIRPLTQLPAPQDDAGATIDGATQTAFTGDTNTAGPEILLSGALSPLFGLLLGGANNVINRLVINGFSSNIRILSNGNRVTDCYLGTNAAGSAAQGGGAATNGAGVDIGRGTGNVIGGTQAGAGNLIGGNVFGVFIHGSGNRVEGNRIGTNAAGTAALPNETGVWIATSTLQAGNDNSVVNNLIAYNQTGVLIQSGNLGAVGNAVSSNSIFGNTSLGLDLGGDGPTPNDVGDSDVGANQLQNFPMLTLARTQDGQTLIQGMLNSLPNTTFTIQLFANLACHSSGSGEGQTFVAATTVTTDAGGAAVISQTLTTALAAGSFVTATATDPGNNTSEFSACVQVIGSGSGSSNLMLYALPKPIRLLDTRAGQTGCDAPGAPIPGGTGGIRTQFARRTCDGITIPPNAQAVTGNITVVPTGGGFLTLFPSSAAQPTVANSNFGPNEVTNNVFTVGLGAGDGAFKIFASATTHVIVDVTGYYAPPGTGGLYFHPLATPVRLLETRAGLNGCIAPSAPLTGTGDPNSDPNLDFAIQGRSPVASPCNSIPASAQMLVGNATSVVPDSGGYLTIYPSGGTRPLIASSNYVGGDVINGPFSVKLGADGKFKIYTLRTTHLVVDILGYYSEEAVDANGIGLLFNPLPVPVRLLETRPGGPPLTGCTRTNAPIQGNLNAATHTQQAAGFCGLPASAQAVVGNASVVSTPAAGYLTLFPGNLTTAPLVATSNYPTPASSGYNRHYFVGLSPVDGTFKVLTSSTTELILDASGYFAP